VPKVKISLFPLRRVLACFVITQNPVMQFGQSIYKAALNEYRIRVLRCVVSGDTQVLDTLGRRTLRQLHEVLAKCRVGPPPIAIDQSALLSERLLTPVDAAVVDLDGILSVYRPVVLEAERRCLQHVDEAIDKRARVIWAERLCNAYADLLFSTGARGIGQLLVPTAAAAATAPPTQTSVYEAAQQLVLGALQGSVMGGGGGAKKGSAAPEPPKYDTVADMLDALRHEADAAEQQVVSSIALDYNAVLEDAVQASVFETDMLLTQLEAAVSEALLDVVQDYRDILRQTGLTQKALTAQVARYATAILTNVDQLFAEYLRAVPVLKKREFREFMKPRTLALAVNSSAGTLAMRIYLMFAPILGTKRPEFAKFSTARGYPYGVQPMVTDSDPMHIVHRRISEYAVEGGSGERTTVGGYSATDKFLDAAYELIAKRGGPGDRADAMQVGTGDGGGDAGQMLAEAGAPKPAAKAKGKAPAAQPQAESPASPAQISPGAAKGPVGASTTLSSAAASAVATPAAAAPSSALSPAPVVSSAPLAIAKPAAAVPKEAAAPAALAPTPPVAKLPG
jgi:phosphoglycolate phosphatase-like HAD superfamily hydrolase